MERFIPNLDDLLTEDQCAEWFQTNKRDLASKSKGLHPKIVPFKPSPKMKRYHPRTVLAIMAREAGVPLDVIAASYGIKAEKGN